MNKLFSIAATVLLGLSAVAFTSCDDEKDEPKAAAPVVNLAEVGEENSKEAVAGKDLHLEGEIVADGLIKRIDVEIHQENGGNFKIEKSYTEGKYIGVKNTTFHEHIDIPADAPAGAYHLHFTVTDRLGQQTTFESELNVTVSKPGSPEITFVEVGEGNSLKAVAGEEMHLEANIKAEKKIAQIVVELHKEDGSYEKEFTFTGKYLGETSATFHEHLQLPADMPAGEYHLHFTVTDAEGNSTTEEQEGVQITSK